jgi:DNA-binding MarR family transcriptional regulator
VGTAQVKRYPYLKRPDDMRKHVVTLTPKGRLLARELAKIIEEGK